MYNYQPNQTNIADGYKKIANVYSEQEKHEEALLYFHRGLDTFLDIVPQPHTDITFTCYHIVLILKTLGRIEESYTYVEKAVQQSFPLDQRHGQAYEKAIKEARDAFDRSCIPSIYIIGTLNMFETENGTIIPWKD